MDLNPNLSFTLLRDLKYFLKLSEASISQWENKGKNINLHQVALNTNYNNLYMGQ